MIKQIVFSLFLLVTVPYAVMAADSGVPHPAAADTERTTYEDILNREPDNTPCATAAFTAGLVSGADMVNESTPEHTVKEWIQQRMSDKDVLAAVLECPELQSAPDNQPIKFMPIKYKFDGGREITINYETQPKLLKQRMALAGKRALNTSIGNDDSVWTNTDPSWYAIMVVQHGALDEFVGPDKSNLISLHHIADNIDDLYPNAAFNGGSCTSRSALAGDSNAINRATHKTVNMESDPNDYYVAGDIDLRWISYLEIALDIVIFVTTYGGGTILEGALKGASSTRALRNLIPTIKTLGNTSEVIDYVRATARATELTEDINKLTKAVDLADDLSDTARLALIADKTAELDKLNDTIKTLEATKNVTDWREATKVFSELNAYRRTLRNAGRLLSSPRRGNVLTRMLDLGKGFKATRNGSSLISKATKIAGKSSSFASRTRSYLFHTTTKHAARLARVTANTGFAYAALKVLGDLYDYTETSTDEYTNGEDFAPLLLLSADDLPGQDNVVNYGMWLMWTGDSNYPADDDAAYLQAMDFATKFYQDLSEIQEYSTDPCNVDIYVVHPVLRNPGEDTELHYLIMNDKPWSTANSKDLLKSK